MHCHPPLQEHRTGPIRSRELDQADPYCHLTQTNLLAQGSRTH